MEDTKSPDLKALQNLWEEFKYRHDLIWQRIFIFTSAIVLISTVPYIEMDIVKRLREWILIAPVLALSLAVFVLFVILNELKIFERIYLAYWQLQNIFLDDDLKHEPRKLDHELRKKSWFSWFGVRVLFYYVRKKSWFEVCVLSYLYILVVLSIANLLIAWLIWIPRVDYCSERANFTA
jgi:hypothetical protein